MRLFKRMFAKYKIVVDPDSYWQYDLYERRWLVYKRVSYHRTRVEAEEALFKLVRSGGTSTRYYRKDGYLL